MKSVLLLAAALISLSGCTQFPWSASDLGTTSIALSQGGREVGAAAVCGSDPVAVLACSATLKVGGYRIAKAVTGDEGKAKRVIEYSGAVGTINNLAMLGGMSFPGSLALGFVGAQVLAPINPTESRSGLFSVDSLKAGDRNE